MTVSTGSTACTIGEGVVHFVAVGTCVLDANQAGNDDYLAAAQVQQTVTVGKGTSVIAITSTAPLAPGVGATYRPTATARLRRRGRRHPGPGLEGLRDQ